MGGKSSSSSTTNSSSKNVLGNTTTSNPYVTSTTTNQGTNSAFAEGSAFDIINNFVNDNISTILQNYLNPTIDDATSQAKLDSFTKNLNEEAEKTLENQIINPLSQRNMIRSSQATDMYNNVQDNINDSISDYTMNLMASSQDNAANILSNLMNMYLNGYNVISNNQSQSLNTSAANAEKLGNVTSNTINTQTYGAKDYLGMLGDTLTTAASLYTGGVTKAK